MTKVIENIGLLKKLQPILEDVKTDYFFFLKGETYKLAPSSERDYWGDHIQYKTLTLEEIIDLFRKHKRKIMYFTSYHRDYPHYFKDVTILSVNGIEFGGKTLLEAIEKMLEYLLDNNLLGKNTNN